MLINENELRSEFKKLQLDESYIKHIIDKVGLYSNKDAKELLEKLIEFTKENNLINSHSWSANTIKKSIEEDDIVGRYGGEEFIVIVKDGNCSFKSKVENIRKNIELLNIECSNEKYIKVTASIGVKRLDVNIKSLEENIALADQLLYKAKSTGKNKVVY